MRLELEVKLELKPPQSARPRKAAQLREGPRLGHPQHHQKVMGHTPRSIKSHDYIINLPGLFSWLGREPNMLKDLA